MLTQGSPALARTVGLVKDGCCRPPDILNIGFPTIAFADQDVMVLAAAISTARLPP